MAPLVGAHRLAASYEIRTLAGVLVNAGYRVGNVYDGAAFPAADLVVLEDGTPAAAPAVISVGTVRLFAGDTKLPKGTIARDTVEPKPIVDVDVTDPSAHAGEALTTTFEVRRLGANGTGAVFTLTAVAQAIVADRESYTLVAPVPVPGGDVPSGPYIASATVVLDDDATPLEAGASKVVPLIVLESGVDL